MPFLVLLALALAAVALVQLSRLRKEITDLQRQNVTLHCHVRDLGKAMEALRGEPDPSKRPGGKESVAVGPLEHKKQAPATTTRTIAEARQEVVRHESPPPKTGRPVEDTPAAPRSGTAGETPVPQLGRNVQAAVAVMAPSLSGSKQQHRAPPPSLAKPPSPAKPPPRKSGETKMQPAMRDVAAAWRRLEESITSRWLVWLGAMMIALAGAFLVKHSIDQGWLGPAVRVALALLLGVALVAAGEWLRRQPLQKAIAAIRPSQVPPALTGAGLFAVFASVYAAYELYDLIGPVLAASLLAAVGLAAVAMAVLQGPLIAALGLIGGFATPYLVAGGHPWPWALFGYLLILVAAALAVVRRTGWWWPAWGSLAGAAAWALYGLGAPWAAEGVLPLGLYLLLLCGLFLVIRRKEAPSGQTVVWNSWLEPLTQSERIVWCAAGVVMLLAAGLVRADGYGLVSLSVLLALSIALVAIGSRHAVFDGLAVVAAVAGCALMVVWHVPAIALPDATLAGPPRLVPGLGLLPLPGLPPLKTPFVAWSLALSAVFGVGGFLALWRARRPVLWAWVSAGVPVIMLALWYWKIAEFSVDPRWSALAAMIATLGFAAAKRVYGRPKLPGRDLVLGAYATAIVVSLSLAAAMTVEQAWLTVALALQLPVLAWAHDRFRISSLRLIALELAVVVILRLVLNVQILDYPISPIPGLNWLIYGYGVPAAAFWFAAERFRRRADDKVVMVLEAGTVAFLALLVTLEIRTLIAGSLVALDYALIEQSVQSIAWLALGYGCLAQYRRRGRKVMLWSWRLLAGLAALQVVGLQTLLFNPLWSGAPVGDWPVLNLLLLAYLAPAGFALASAYELRKLEESRAALGAGLAGLALVFVYLSLELRHLYHGSLLSQGTTGLMEIYSYGALWLALAYGYLAAWRRRGGAALLWAWRGLAGLAAGYVLLVHGLIANPLWSGDAVGGWPILNLLALGFLVPAGFALLLAREFDRHDLRQGAMAARLTGLGLIFVFVSLELRHWFHGPLLSEGSTGLAEIYSYASAWLVLAYGWFVWHRRHGGTALNWAWQGLAALAVGQVVLVHVVVANPLWSGHWVAPVPIVNELALAYLVPAWLILQFGRALRQSGEDRLAGMAVLSCFGLVLLYAVLEVRHLFQGPNLSGAGMSDGELYAYSLVCLIFALASLALGIRLRIASLRYLSLALLLAGVAKVFLLDMAALTGLLRVVSFLAMGLSLVAIGYFYQRFVFPPREAMDPGEGKAVAAKPG